MVYLVSTVALAGLLAGLSVFLIVAERLLVDHGGAEDDAGGYPR